MGRWFVEDLWTEVLLAPSLAGRTQEQGVLWTQAGSEDGLPCSPTFFPPDSQGKSNSLFPRERVASLPEFVL